MTVCKDRIFRTEISSSQILKGPADQGHLSPGALTAKLSTVSPLLPGSQQQLILRGQEDVAQGWNVLCTVD